VNPKNKDGLLLRYRETCTQVAEPVTYQEQDEEEAAHIATSNVGVGVPTDGIASAAVGSHTARAGVASADVGSRAACAGVASGVVGSCDGVASASVGSFTDRAAVSSHTDHTGGGSPNARAAIRTPTAALWSLGTSAG
jgi:hypothetical protein